MISANQPSAAADKQLSNAVEHAAVASAHEQQPSQHNSKVAKPSPTVGKPSPGRYCMIDGISVPPHVLQALQNLRQPDANQPHNSGGQSALSGILPLSACRNVAPSSQSQPRASAFSERPTPNASENSTKLSPPASQAAQRPEPADCHVGRDGCSRMPGPISSLTESSTGLPEDDEGVSGMSGVSDDACSIDSQDSDSQLQQLVELRRIVDELRRVTDANVLKIEGFDQDIAQLLHSKDLMTLRVGELRQLLQEQEDEIANLRLVVRDLRALESAEEAATLQRSTSSSCHFDG